MDIVIDYYIKLASVCVWHSHINSNLIENSNNIEYNKTKRILREKKPKKNGRINGWIFMENGQQEYIYMISFIFIVCVCVCYLLSHCDESFPFISSAWSLVLRSLLLYPSLTPHIVYTNFFVNMQNKQLYIRIQLTRLCTFFSNIYIETEPNHSTWKHQHCMLNSIRSIHNSSK